MVLTTKPGSKAGEQPRHHSKCPLLSTPHLGDTTGPSDDDSEGGNMLSFLSMEQPLHGTHFNSSDPYLLLKWFKSCHILNLKKF